MNKEEILKGLECCASPVTMCNECPYVGRCSEAKSDALKLIAEQDEIEKYQHSAMRGMSDLIHLLFRMIDADGGKTNDD